jgi:hypothetical protein
MDADDVATVALTEGLPRLVNPAGGGAVTAVRNWNAAAAVAKGDLMVVIADDLLPPYGWDQTLIEMIGRLDPVRTPFAVKVADSPGGDALLRHPVISRAFYTKFGLFSPSYRGVYCDTDLTARAFWHSMILDGRALQLEHRHPAFTGEILPSESHHRVNQPQEYARGRAAYVAAWSRRQRAAQRRFVPTASAQRRSHWRLVLMQRELRASSNISYVIHGCRTALRSVCRGSEPRST